MILGNRLQIRTAKEEDLPALEWDGEYRHFHRLYSEIFESTRKGRAIMWIAEMEPVGLVGQLFVQLISGRPELADGAYRGYIYGFRVKLAYRSQGIGTQMMEVAENDLLKRGFRWVTLNVGHDNPEARRLYERLGYRVVAEEPGQWSYQDEYGQRHEVHEPAWRMEKRLSQKQVSRR